MSYIDKLVSQVLLVVKTFGLDEIIPVILSNGGNLIIHLAPYPIVARLANVITQEEANIAYKRLNRELQIARHLQIRNVPVLLPTDLVDAGPHNVDDTWMTLWNYVPPIELQRPSPSESVELVSKLSIAMKDFSEELPVLGVWERTCRSAARLMKNSDPRIQALLEMFHEVDKKMRLETSVFIPSHGDAHAGNLVPSTEGWIWTDFEDVSLMPAYWDLASFVGNLALFNGFKDPTLSYMLSNKEVILDPKAFTFALTARILMSTIGNLDYAFEGYGDLEFATQQLELAGDFISHINI
ncbi:phosphotransferase [Paenibacillus gallinarum]|uniref:Phosphotransferase n=1 Tax=Paenibacillus gallinarum TaxID=2762232 RepID=A0ABR8T0K7_9BACL|nr:phosphotransferase [Paenibacillus gallinarum]MBD7969287.1 phosphotransferase [Paenibacillus gallinarum]